MAVKYKYGTWKFDTVGFASVVRAAMKTSGLQQQQVAEMCEVSPATISTIVQGVYPQQERLPSVSIVLALCNLFDLDIRDYWYVEW